jgi:hypothetical protein
MLGTSGRRIRLTKAGTFVFDEVLYKERTSARRVNGWQDGFKALLVRFGTKARNWLAYIAFLVVFFEKSTLKIKFKQLYILKLGCQGLTYYLFRFLCVKFLLS